MNENQTDDEEAAKSERLRVATIKELTQTEEGYLNDLKILEEVFGKKKGKKIRAWWDLNPQSSAPEADALTIRLQTHYHGFSS